MSGVLLSVPGVETLTYLDQDALFVNCCNVKHDVVPMQQADSIV
jgi:hypothetical protein